MKDLPHLARMLQVIATSTRVQVIRLLKGRTLCVGALSARLDVTQRAVSQHLRILREAGLVVHEKRGYDVHYQLNHKALLRWKDAIDEILEPQNTRIDTNVLMGVLFSLTMGLAFLGIGLSQCEQSTLLGLLWGSLNFVTVRDLSVITATVLALTALTAAFYKELRAILFSRELARAGGVHEAAVWTGYPGLTALTLAVNLNAVGGLMIFSLLSNPAVAAAQLARSYLGMLVWSACLGAASAVLGFFAAYAFGWPTGASIVLTSGALLAAVVMGRLLLARTG